jgi:hypothetical protein
VWQSHERTLNPDPLPSSIWSTSNLISMVIVSGTPPPMRRAYLRQADGGRDDTSPILRVSAWAHSMISLRS